MRQEFGFWPFGRPRLSGIRRRSTYYDTRCGALLRIIVDALTWTAQRQLVPVRFPGVRRRLAGTLAVNGRSGVAATEPAQDAVYGELVVAGFGAGLVRGASAAGRFRVPRRR